MSPRQSDDAECAAREARPHPDLDILDLAQVRLEVVLALPILEELTQRKGWCPFHPELSEDATERENVHRFGDPAVSLPELEVRLFVRDVGAGSVEALGRQVAGSARRRVEVEGEAGRVVEGKESRFEGG